MRIVCVPPPAKKAAPLTIVTFVFTTCDGVCPMQGRRLAALQTALGDRIGRDVRIVSISIDPDTDTPPRLRAWRAPFGIPIGWTLVTGERQTLQTPAAAFPGVASSKGEQ